MLSGYVTKKLITPIDGTALTRVSRDQLSLSFALNDYYSVTSSHNRRNEMSQPILAIEDSEVPKAAANLLPCRLHHDGPVDPIQPYWKPVCQEGKFLY